MRQLIPLLAVCGFTILLAGPSSVEAQKKTEKGKYDPPDAFVPKEDVLKEIAAKTAQLRNHLSSNEAASARFRGIPGEPKNAFEQVRDRQSIDKGV